MNVPSIVFFPDRLLPFLRAMHEVPPVHLNRVAVEAGTLPSCDPLTSGDGPQYETRYWGSALLGPMATDVVRGIPFWTDLDAALAGHSLSRDSCTVGVGMRFCFRQRWFFRQLAIGDVATTLSLAPGERIELDIRKTQRKYLQSTTLEQVDAMFETESTVVDKDVLNIVRSAAKENNWRLALDSDFEIFGIGAKTSASQEGSARNRVDTTIQHLRDATRKSAENLKFLQKTEVVSRAESSLDERAGRVIQNPYRDRGLTLRVFDLVKRYMVETRFEGLQPMLVFDLSGFVFTDEFVRQNESFLVSHLLDRSLLQGLLTSGLDGRSDVPDIDRSLARAYASEAFEFLYSDVANYLDEPNLNPNIVGGGAVDRLLVSLSFTGFAKNAAYGDPAIAVARAKGAGGLFAALGFYYRWYVRVDKTKFAQSDDVVRRAVALARYVGPKWEHLASADQDELLSLKHMTEIFRRLPGFLSLVDGLVGPLIGETVLPPSGSMSVSGDSVGAEGAPSEASVSSREGPEPTLSRLNSGPTQRVVEHLNCYRQHYVATYLSYLSSLSNGIEIRFFAADALRSMLRTGAQHAAVADELLKRFDVDRLIVSETQILIPSAGLLDDSELLAIDQLFPGNTLHLSDVQLARDLFDVVEDLEVPADGVHIEPLTSACILEEVPALPQGEVRIGDFEARVSSSQPRVLKNSAER